MLESTLRTLIPSVANTFDKLTPGRGPYGFDRWTDGAFYYNVSRRANGVWNKKRAKVSEIRAALGRLRQSSAFTRRDFQELCPVAQRDGGCGFCVVGRVLELLGAARFSGKGLGFVLLDRQRADELLAT